MSITIFAADAEVSEIFANFAFKSALAADKDRQM